MFKDLESAMKAYKEKFGVFFPYVIGKGYPGGGGEGSIRIIEECIVSGKKCDPRNNYSNKVVR